MVRLQALDASWKAHFEQDHRPFRRDCKVCLQAAARGRKHRRLSHPVCFSLSLDIMGPLGPGEDVDASFAFKPTKSYALVAAYTLPILSDGELITHEAEDQPIPSEWPEAADDPVPASEVDPLPEEGEAARVARVQAYKDVVSSPVWVQTIFMADPLVSTKDEHVRLAVMRMIVRLRNGGCPVHTFYSDLGRQLVSSTLRAWLTEQTIAFSDTGGEDPQANGRAELAVQHMKSHVRRLLKATGFDKKWWPALLRHAAERSWREAMSKCGAPQQQLLACGAEVQVRPRSWQGKGPWKDKAIQGRVLGHAPFTSNVYAILLPDGKVITSSTVVATQPSSTWCQILMLLSVRGVGGGGR